MFDSLRGCHMWASSNGKTSAFQAENASSILVVHSIHRSVAQMAEQLTFNQRGTGSRPVGSTRRICAVNAVCPGGEGAVLKTVGLKGLAGSNPVHGAIKICPSTQIGKAA